MRDAALEEVRERCLAFPDVEETTSYDHPVFKSGKKAFVAIEQVKGRPSIAVRADPDRVDLLLKDPRFFATPYGRGKWVSVWADEKIDWRLLGDLIAAAYGLATRKPRRR
jgi:predicted DNA-binding protein (MmcQ/YjbR family)